MSAGLRAAFLVTVLLLGTAGAIRVWALPRFTVIPGRFQILIEQFVHILGVVGRFFRAVLSLPVRFFRAVVHAVETVIKVAVQNRKGIAAWMILSGALLAAALLIPWETPGTVSPGVGQAVPVEPNAGTPFLVTGVILLIAAAVRLWMIPRFTVIPGRFQLLLEQFVGLMDRVGQVVRLLGGVIRRVWTALVWIAAAVTGFVDRNRKAVAIWAGTAAVFLFAGLLFPAPSEHENVQIAMRDAVLHDVNRVGLFGLKAVNPGLIAALTVTGILLFTALLLRVFLIPRMSVVPGRVQLALEQIVDLLDGLSQSRGRISFVGAYVFAAGTYIFTGTLFELLGLQAVATNGASVTLPAPLSDVNAAICMGCLSYLVIFGGGVTHAGLHGAGAAIKEFSLPISMSFRLFGALLSGLLVTDLIYHYAALRFVLPVVVGVIFTLLHALIQSYVLTMLVGIYYAEVSERPENPPKTGKSMETELSGVDA